ncbi:hypothetical protein JCM21900_005915 [Sporobolomyces salmonicolor]
MSSLRLRPRRPPPAPPPPKPFPSPLSFNPFLALASAFDSLGRLISTHQVPSLLVTALIICSLLSPSLLLYFAPSGSPYELSTSPLTRRGRGELVWELEGMKRQGVISSEEDVCWERVKTYYEKTGREGGGRRIRVEQVLIAVAGAGATPGSRGPINKQVLHRAWRVQKELERRLVDGSVPGNRCLEADGRCAVVSPAGWWKSENDLLQDDDVHSTLSRPPVPLNGTAASYAYARHPLGLPLTISETFVGAGRDRQGFVKSAQQLVVTFFLEDVASRSSVSPASSLADLPNNSTQLEDSAREEARVSWRRAVREVIDRVGWPKEANMPRKDPMGLMVESKSATRRVLLKFLPHLTVDDHPRRLENAIYAIGYLLVILYVSRYIRKLRAHSKMGLLVTGIVELCSSGIMSVSICWLMGWTLGLVPWNLMVFLVLTSGLDNMILVLRAIANTDMNLPVPERMSIGLRSVGVEMTVLLVVEELIGAALLWWVEISVMREWIRFGAVVLAVDYFLELTFFSTVLSIDIQRLELADLLGQNAFSANQTQVSPSVTGQPATAKSTQSHGKLARKAWKVLRDRPAKTSTVAFLWLINFLLWTFYGPEHYLPATCSQAALSSDRPFLSPSLDPSLSRALRLGQADPSAASHLSIPVGAASAFWRLVNPSTASSVQVYLEPTISIQLFEEGALIAPESVELAAVSAAEAGPWFVARAALVMLPIAAVMALLYLLLLYLLKDAELLQARWGSEERVSGREKDGQDGATGVRRKGKMGGKPAARVEVVKGLKARHKGDVELIASGGDVVVSWAGLEEEVQVRRRSGEAAEDSPSSTTQLHIPLSAEPVSLVTLAVDQDGRFCAAATTKGRVLAWALQRGGTVIDFGTEIPSCGAVLALVAPSSETRGRRGTEQKKGEWPAPPSTIGGKGKEEGPSFFSLHRDGKVVRWDCGACRAVMIYEALGEVNQLVKRTLVSLSTPINGSTAPFLAQMFSDGRLHLVQLDGSDGQIIFDHVLPEPFATLAIGSFPVLSSTRALVEQPLVAISTHSGDTSLYTLSPTPVRLTTLSGFANPIRQLRLVQAPQDSVCPFCQELITDGFLAALSNRTVLKVFRIFTPSTPASVEACICNTADALDVVRSRVSSVATGPAMSRVLSNGASSRRFSPRKQPSTPTRLPASFGIGMSDNSLRPAARSRSYGSHESQSSSSSSSGSSAQERVPPPFSTLSAPLPPPRSASSSSLSNERPPPSFSGPLPNPPPESSPSDNLPTLEPPLQSQLRAIEVASLAIDDRSGWEVADNQIIGLRRRRGDDGRGWEVWALALGKDGAGFDEGFDEGTTPLLDLLKDGLVADETGEDGRDAAAAGPPSTPSRNSVLRRRNVPLSAPRASSSPAPPALPPSSAIRFSPDQLDLPFSCARPVVSAFEGSAVAVGLGNQLVALRAKEMPVGDGGALQPALLGL